MTTTLVRTGSAMAVAGLLVGMLSACTPEAKPSPQPKTAAFGDLDLGSAEAAAKAAEGTYSGYVAASNRVDLSVPESLEPVFDWLTGDALVSARESYSAMRADDLTLAGESAFDEFELISHGDEGVIAELCADVSEVDLRNAEGDSVIPPDRVPRQRVEVEFLRSDTSTGLAIARSSVVQEKKC